MKEGFLVAGVAIGAFLALIGLALQFARADNSDADALAAALRYFVGLPMLGVGALLVLLCSLGLRH